MTNFFGPGSPYLTHPLLTKERTALEVDALISWCPDAPKQVLDVGCGFGRHCLEFARRGIGVTGFDPSPTMLEAARLAANQEGFSIDFVEGVGENLTRKAEFDLAISMFTTLGQIDSAQGNACVDATLSNLSRALRPGGTLVVEVPERGRAIRALVRDEQLGPTAVTRAFNPATSVLTEQFVTPTDTFELAYVLFSKDELADAVESAGFTISAIRDAAVQTPPFTFMTVVARS